MMRGDVMKTVYFVRVNGWCGSVAKGNYEQVEFSAICATRELAEELKAKYPSKGDLDGDSTITEYVLIESEDQL